MGSLSPSFAANPTSKSKSFRKARSWLRRKPGYSSFSAGEDSDAEAAVPFRHMSDNEGLAGVRQEAGDRRGKERKKFDPRRLVGRSTTEFSSMSEPPRGYLWIWLGHFKRWHRRFFVLTTPGALAYSKRHDLKGNSWTMSLSGASVVRGKPNSRQFLLVTKTRTLYLRTISRESREMWIASLEQSIQTYQRLEKRAREVSHIPRLSEDHYASLEVDPQMQKLQRDLRTRMQAKMARLQPSQQDLEACLDHIVQSLSRVWSSLGCTPSSVPEQAGALEERALTHPRGAIPPSGLLENSRSATTSRNESSSIRTAYTNLMALVEQVVRDEAVLVLELQAENRALRRLLRDKQGDSRPIHRTSTLPKSICEAPVDMNGCRNDAQENDEIESLSSSQSYSTAGSHVRREEEEDEPFDFETGDLLQEEVIHNPNQPLLDTDLITALETVRQVEYASKSRTICELGEDGGEGPPGDANDLDEDMDIAAQEDSDTSSPTAAVRTRLPCPKPLRRGFSIWSILKNAIGRDLTKITLPATINEPLSALQRVAEEFEYYSLLEKAAGCSDPQERLVHVTAFVLSSYNSGLLRDSKPFNPLLGETFEWQGDRLYFLAEQVSHHPPVSCFSAKGMASPDGQPLFSIHGEFELRSKFWGKTLSVFPTGRCDLSFPHLNEHYTWNKSNLSIHNIIIGKLWIDLHGEVRVQNISTGAHSLVTLPKCAAALSTRGIVRGHVVSATGEVTHGIDGNYTSIIYASQSQKDGAESKVEIFKCNDPPDDSEEQYNMTTFAIGLNDFQRFGLLDLPKTDARFRPDVRALENGEFDLATSEKLRLEEKQRHARRMRKEENVKYEPLWFKLKDENDKELVKPSSEGCSHAWVFNEQYWEKNHTLWEKCPDIY